MPRRVSEEVRIMEAFRALPVEKREVVLNLAIAEFRQPKKGKDAKKTGGAIRPRIAARPNTLDEGRLPARPVNGELYAGSN